jgi:phenylpropionate dioxygenase-like ring-hydroxylating dioxygenase large terminal subunit
VWKWETTYPANWKVAIENLLESYHIPCLHPRTFRNYPHEDNVVHEMHANWTSFHTDEMDAWVKNGVRRTTKALGLPFTGAYTQWHVYPNLVFIQMDTFQLAKVVIPTSPTTSASSVWVYSPFGPKRGLIAWIAARLSAKVARDGARKILHEDASIFADVQRGLQASCHTGVIGRREERVHAFQEWIVRRCSL